MHQAFCQIAFDTVVTTNIDFLLESGWAALRRPVDLLVGESRLTARRRTNATLLLKFHGDVNHPDELVVTENDYDSFSSRFPLLGTAPASLLMSKVPVFIGYSLNDVDFRGIMALREPPGRARANAMGVAAFGDADGY